MKKQYLLLALLLLGWQFLIGQSISGYIIDKNKAAIPYVNIFVQQVQTGTTTDENGYYYMRLDPGPYNIVISAIGYEDKSVTVDIDDEETVNFQLASSDYELDEITIKASKKDPAYAIINKAIKHKEKYQNSIQSLRAKAYIKAVEELEVQEKPERVSAEKVELDEDPFKAAEAAKAEKFSKLNLLETELILNFQQPNNYKDEKIAYKVYGSKAGLYVPRFDEVQFDFYDNLVKMYEITSTPIVSPLSRRAILSYKYKLIESKKEGDLLVHKIKIIPRKKGNATVTGYVYINDAFWNINRIDVHLTKNNMKLFDELNIKLDYTIVKDSIWYPTRQELIYSSKAGRKKKFKGRTTMSFSELELDYQFPDKFFGNEVSILTQEAIDKDSTYWNAHRPEALKEKEQNLVLYRDSIETVINSPAYKDSIQREYNKVDFLDVAYEGIGLQFHKTKESISLPSLLSLISFRVVGGWRAGSFMSYYKRFENEMAYRTSVNFSVGFNNKDLLFNNFHWWRYNPMKQGDLIFNVSRDYFPINVNDAFLNYLRSSNYFQHDRIVLRHNIELFNGFELFTGIEWSARQDISHIEADSTFDLVIDPGEVINFDPYNTFKSNIRISYTPFRKYITEPKRKVILGSDWPTFSLQYEKGWKGPFESILDYDYFEFSINQNIVVGTLGSSRYNIVAGTYANTNNLTFIDIKNIRQADPILYAFPLENFQALDTGFVTSEPFIEFHYVHHFDGALVNNIPLIKKTKISVVAGGGLLYAQEANISHQEIFLGLERIFRLGPRRRLRLGVYGIAGTKNSSQEFVPYKVSFDIIDTWKRDWSF